MSRDYSRYRRLQDGPPDADEGWIQNVEETGPTLTAFDDSVRECWHCDAEIYVGREEFVTAHAILRKELGRTSTKVHPKLRFCSWDCWQDWASQ